MAAKNFEILKYSEVQSFSVDVTEQISEKYLLDFLRTSVTNQQGDFTKKSKFYYKFLSSTNSYEIIVFEAQSCKTLPEPFVFLTQCEQNTKELFITENYFCLFENQELILYKKIENIVQEDIQTYIEQLYKIKIDKVIVVDNQKLQNIKKEFLDQVSKYKFDFYCVTKNNSFFIFVVFVVLLSLVFTISLYLSYENNLSIVPKKLSSKYEKGYKELYEIYNNSDNKAIDKTIKFSNYCSKNGIVVEKISYKNSKLYFQLTYKNRKELFESLRNYSTNIEIAAIEFDKVLNTYKVDIVKDVKK